MISVATALMAGSSMPSLSTTPGRKFCTSTSAVAARRFRMARPSPVLRSRVMERLLRLRLRNWAENPRWPVAERAGVVALFRLLHLDDVGTLVGEDHRCPRPRQH